MCVRGQKNSVHEVLRGIKADVLCCTSVVCSESLQLGSIIKALETQTQELKSALSGMRDVVNNSESVPTTFVRGNSSFY